MADAAIFTFSKRGPLFRLLSIVPPAEEWYSHGAALTQQLTSATTTPTTTPTTTTPTTTPTTTLDLLQDPVLASRIFHFYLPIFFWCRTIVKQARQTHPNRAVGIGLSAVQGCGKTTLVNLLTDCFKRDGLVCANVSYDDFYLTGTEQDAVADRYKANPLLQVRGNAGTHDLGLGTGTLKALLNRECNVLIPRYDKSARGGRGDRGVKSTWAMQAESADVVLLEGWMAGFEALPMTEATRARKEEKDSEDMPTKHIQEINQLLQQYTEWHDQMNYWIVVGIDDVNHVYRWRLEAEHAMKKTGRDGMSDEQVHDFVSRYMPAYRTYLPGLYASSEKKEEVLMVKVGGDRQVL
jgi:D-glycerate 3-kinase